MPAWSLACPPGQSAAHPGKQRSRPQIACLRLWGRLVSDLVFLLERLIYLTKIECTVKQKLNAARGRVAYSCEEPGRQTWRLGGGIQPYGLLALLSEAEQASHATDHSNQVPHANYALKEW